MVSTRPSVSSCRNSRPRVAPSAVRTAYSRARESARATSRFARFAHAISSTNPTAACSTTSASLMLPMMSSRSGSMRTRWPCGFGTCPCGAIVRHCSSRRSMSASACGARHPVLQPADQIEEVAAAGVGEVRRVDRERPPDLDLRVVHVVAARHDADDLLGTVVDLDVLPDDAGIAAVGPLPELVREDRHRRRVRHRVGRGEPAARQRLHVQRRHQLGRDQRRDRTARRLRVEVDGANRVGADRGERLVVVAELDELRQRHPELVEPEPRELAGDVLQPIRLRIGQRPQQHAVDDAEHRRVGADAERERQDRDDVNPGCRRSDRSACRRSLRSASNMLPREIH